jgi:peptidoglycan/LPS O-acetylase OafA/YrhL
MVVTSHPSRLPSHTPRQAARLHAAARRQGMALLVIVCATGVRFSPDGMHNHSYPWRDLGRCVSEFIFGLAVFRVYASGCWQIFRKDALVICSILAAVLLNLPEILTVLLFPALILALSLNKGTVARIFSLPFARFLGKISFSLYLVHDNLRPLTIRIVAAIHPGPIPPPLAMLLAAICTVLVIFPAWACFVWIERPCRSWLRQFGQRLQLSQAGNASVVNDIADGTAGVELLS